jgi:Tfp pilus tip-associated adhesin PilY1
VTFQLNQMQPNDWIYVGLHNREPCWNVHIASQQVAHQDSSAEFCMNSQASLNEHVPQQQKWMLKKIGNWSNFNL